MIQLADCTFSTIAVDDGLFTGRCAEYPELRTRRHRRRLDALDDIIDRTSRKIAELDAAAAGLRPAPTYPGPA